MSGGEWRKIFCRHSKMKSRQRQQQQQQQQLQQLQLQQQQLTNEHPGLCKRLLIAIS